MSSRRSERSRSSTTATSSQSCRESPFYAAGGGQVTDAGTLELDDGSGAVAELVDAYRLDADQVLLFRGTGFASGDRVRARVPWAVRFRRWRTTPGRIYCTRRCATSSASTCARQARRSDRDKLRFDFTHDHALSSDERDASSVA
jgi:alanyl-tRNA synthetase